MVVNLLNVWRKLNSMSLGISLTIFILAFISAGYLLKKHWYELWVPAHELDPKIRETHKKHELTLKQLKRGVAGWHTIAKTIFVPLWLFIKRFFLRLYEKVREIEAHYQRMVKVAMLSGPRRVEVISGNLTQAEEAMANSDWVKAEEKFIEVIAIEKTHRRAYEGLANVYFQSGQWKEALETYKFLSRLLQADAPVIIYQRWAQSALELKRPGQALEALKKAIEIEPNNPRTLDLYCESAILGERVDLASQALEQLQSANPENNKITVFAERIQNLKQKLVADTK